MLISVGKIISESIRLYRENMQLFLQYVGILFLVGAVTVIMELILAMLGWTATGSFTIGLIYFLVVLAVALGTFWVSIAFLRVVAKKYQAQNPDAIKQEVMKAGSFIWPGILVSILTSLIIMGGLILLIIPGIIFTIWLAFSFYAVAIEEKGVIEALSFSKGLVQGRWWGVLWRLLAPAIVFAIVLLIAQGIITGIFTYVLPSHYLTVAMLGLISAAVTMFFTPLTTAAPTILYLELKKTATAPATPKPSKSVPVEPPKK